MTASTPSLRRMWTVYRRLVAVDGDYSARALIAAQAAFYAGARGILSVLARLAERGDYDELHAVIKAHDRARDTFQ
jgi:hypothetical protein